MRKTNNKIKLLRLAAMFLLLGVALAATEVPSFMSFLSRLTTNSHAVTDPTSSNKEVAPSQKKQKDCFQDFRKGRLVGFLNKYAQKADLNLNEVVLKPDSSCKEYFKRGESRGAEDSLRFSGKDAYLYERFARKLKARINKSPTAKPKNGQHIPPTTRPAEQKPVSTSTSGTVGSSQVEILGPRSGDASARAPTSIRSNTPSAPDIILAKNELAQNPNTGELISSKPAQKVTKPEASKPEQTLPKSKVEVLSTTIISPAK